MLTTWFLLLSRALLHTTPDCKNSDKICYMGGFTTLSSGLAIAATAAAVHCWCSFFETAYSVYAPLQKPDKPSYLLSAWAASS